MNINTDLLAVLVLGYLRRWCRGRAAARSQARVARDLSALGLRVAPRAVRDAISALAGDGWPVGTVASRPGGAYFCTTREDFLAAYRHLTDRLITQARRCRALRRTLRAALSGQLSLDLGAAAAADSAFRELANAPLLAADLGDRMGGGRRAARGGTPPRAAASLAAPAGRGGAAGDG